MAASEYERVEWRNASRVARRESTIWQRRYWEHTIRDKNDLYKHLDYIHYNPIKHGYVKSAKDWKYSSFNKFVKMNYYEPNWCNFEDKYDILSKAKDIILEPINYLKLIKGEKLQKKYSLTMI